MPSDGSGLRERPASPFRPQQSGARLVSAVVEAAGCSTRAPLQARGLSGERGAVKEGRGGEERGKENGKGGWASGRLRKDWPLLGVKSAIGPVSILPANVSRPRDRRENPQEEQPKPDERQRTPDQPR